MSRNNIATIIQPRFVEDVGTLKLCLFRQI